MNSERLRGLIAKWRDEVPPECTCPPIDETMDSNFHKAYCPRYAWNKKHFQCCEVTQRKCADELEAALGELPTPIFDLQLFYDQLVDGQIIKESDGDPWPLTKSEAKQIVDALAERLKMAWPLRAAPTEPAGGAQLRGEEAWLDEFVTAAISGTSPNTDKPKGFLRNCLRTCLRAFAANYKRQCAAATLEQKGTFGTTAVQNDPKFIEKMREFAKECLRRIKANPHVDGDELHTKETYADILILCAIADAAGQSAASLSEELVWQLAACGAHSNRYGEADSVWDSTCLECLKRRDFVKRIINALLRSQGQPAERKETRNAE